MRSKILLGLTVLLLGAGTAAAQQHEIAFTSGALRVAERGFDLPRPGIIKFGTGFTYQVNYAQRFFDAKLAALYFEVPLIGTPRTKVTTSNALSPRSYSSIFIVPGMKLKLLPGSKYSPYGMAGVGYARFNESQTSVDNGPNPGERGTNRAVFNYGIGLDVKVFPFVSFRGEVRDTVSGSPKFNVLELTNKQRNTLFSAGIVLRF